ncbi:hypothetical protein PtB15_8B164 [Puccinia triticina]|nr:hypothetical protein PtB15_8B164 [Puccinia triticina]
MSGAGWDETSKTVILPMSVWRELWVNKSKAGRNLSRWQHRPFPLFHVLAGLIEGNVATGEDMETTEDNDELITTQRDIGNDIPPDSPNLDDSNDECDDQDDIDEDKPQAPPKRPVPTPTPTAAKRKRVSAMLPDGILTELQSMNTSLAASMSAPIPPLVFSTPAPPPSVHMQAITLVQKETDLTPEQIFQAINFFRDPSNSKVYISLNDILRPTWLRSELGW